MKPDLGAVALEDIAQRERPLAERLFPQRQRLARHDRALPAEVELDEAFPRPRREVHPPHLTRAQLVRQESECLDHGEAVDAQPQLVAHRVALHREPRQASSRRRATPTSLPRRACRSALGSPSPRRHSRAAPRRSSATASADSAATIWMNAAAARRPCRDTTPAFGRRAQVGGRRAHAGGERVQQAQALLLAVQHPVTSSSVSTMPAIAASPATGAACTLSSRPAGVAVTKRASAEPCSLSRACATCSRSIRPKSERPRPSSASSPEKSCRARSL